MKTNNFKDYIKKEIFSLLNNSKPIIQHHPHCACISKQETPYLQCLAKHENVYWKLYSREKMGVNINSIKLDRERRGAQGQGVNRNKSAFYRNLLKAEQTINDKQAIQSAKTAKLSRGNIQTTSSGRRRQCLDSQLENNNKNEDIVNSKLLIRQSSVASEKYLKAKTQFKHRRPASVMAHFKIIKI